MLAEASDQGAEAEGRYRAAFAQAAVGLAILDAEGSAIREANPQLCRLLGYDTLAGKPLAELRSADARPRIAGIESWRLADGRAVDLRVRGMDGPSATLVVEPVDPDEMVRAEQNRAALTAAGLGEWRWDAATGYVTLSRRAGQILGYPPGPSVTWSTLRESIEAHEGARVGAQVREAVERAEAYAFECRFTREADRQVVVIAVRGQPVVGPDGAVAGMVGVVQDTTTRVAQRDALLGREERLRVATGLARLGIFEWQMLDDAAIWENERMFEIFGRSPEDGSVGKAEFLNTVLHPEDRAPVRAAISAALRADAPLQITARIRRRDDGAWRVIDMAGRFERDAPDQLPRRLIGVVADVTDRRRAAERQTLLIRELHHRVKNTLATVQAIVGSTARTASSIESFYEAFVGRIMSLSHTHSVLTEDTWQTASLRGLLVNELKPYAEGTLEDALDDRVRLDGPPVDLPSEIAVPIGMAIHELTTNAAKYGALSNRAGRVAITWALLPDGEAGRLHFEWRESGGPPVSPPSRQGFGSRLLQRVLTTQVQAEVTTDYAAEGLHLTMLAPLPARNAALNPLA